jgi:Tfp pilus assembly protein PilF
VGLITKAISKAEKDQSPPAEQEKLPQPKGKKKLIIAFLALLFLCISLGSGYLFWIKPSLEPPPKEVRRRPIGARKRPAKPAPERSEGKTGADATNAQMAEPTSVSAQTPKQAIARQEPTKKTGAVSRREGKTAVSEKEPSGQTTESQASPVQQEPESIKTPSEMIPEPKEGSRAVESPIDKPREPVESAIEMLPETEGPQPPEQEEQSPTDIALPQSEEKDSEISFSDETTFPAPEDMPAEAVTPRSFAQLREEWKQPALEVTEISGSRAQRYYKKGASYHQQGELSRAIDSYKEALTFNPDHLTAHVNLATAYLQTGRLKEAEQELVYLYALKPKDAQILFNFGLLLYRTGEYISAETKLKKLLDSEPLHVEANLLLASIHEEKEELDKALELCIKAYQINSANPRVLYRLGRAWDMAKDPLKAAKYYRLFLKTAGEEQRELESAVRDRLKYLISQGEE